jgi:hypothetical protein
MILTLFSEDDLNLGEIFESRDELAHQSSDHLRVFVVWLDSTV